MAKIDPRTGALSGKLGDMIYSSWRGQPYVRKKPERNPNRKRTPAQLAQQQRFALAMHFINTMGPLLNLAFSTTKDRQTGKNAAHSYICKNAITGQAPDLELDFPHILISHGLLPGTTEASATPEANGQLKFQWISMGDKGFAANSDKVLLALYCPALESSMYHTSAADRKAETLVFDASPFSGHTVHSWLGFISEDGKLASDSIYTGSFLIS
jgi:hypothetical protein